MADEEAVTTPEISQDSPVQTISNPNSDIGGDPKKTLYLRLKTDKLYNKSFDEFRQQFSTPEKVSKLHDLLAQKGKYSKGADAFNAQFFPEVKAPKDVTPPADAGKKKDLSAPAAQPGSPSLPPGGDNGQASQNIDLPTADLTGLNGGAPKAPIVLQGDAAVVAQQQANEYAANQQAKQDQTKNNVIALLDEFAKSHPLPKDRSQPLRDALNEDPEKVAARLRAKQPKEDELSAGQQVLGTLANLQTQAYKGIGEGMSGLVSAANYLVHTIVPEDVLTEGGTKVDSQGRDQYDKAKDNVNSYIRNLAGSASLNLSDAETEKVNKNPISNALGMVANFAPAAMAAGPTKGLSFFYQGYGQADEQIKQLKDKGVDISPQAENAYSLGYGLLNYGLMNMVNAHSIVSKFPLSLRRSIVGNLSAEGIKELADKGATATGDDILKTFMGPAMTFDQRVKQFGIDGVKSYLQTSADLAAFTTLDAALKAGVNKENEAQGGGELFHQTAGQLIDQYKNILTTMAPAFTVFGAGRSFLDNPGLLFHDSPYTNLVTDRLHADPSPENVAAIKEDIGAIGKRKGWSDDEIANTQQAVDGLADVAQTLPRDLRQDKFREGVDLIAGRRQLQDVLAETQSRKEQLDPAFQSQVGPFEELLNAKIDQANDKLSTLVTEKKFTYYEADGKYFKKQVDSEPVEINKTRYDLESVENDHKPNTQKSIVMPQGTTDKNGNPVPPAQPKEGEPVVKKADITDEDYQQFVDKNKVSDETVQTIAMKVRDKMPLTEREKAVFANRTEDINKAIVDSLKPEEPTKPTTTNAKTETSAPAKEVPAEKPAVRPEPKKEPVEKVAEPVKPVVEPAKPVVAEKTTTTPPERDEHDKVVLGAIDQVSNERSLSEGVKNALMNHFGYDKKGKYYTTIPFMRLTRTTSPERLKSFIMDAGASILKEKFGEHSNEYSQAIDDLHKHVASYIQLMLDAHEKGIPVEGIQDKKISNALQTVFDVLDKIGSHDNKLTITEPVKPVDDKPKSSDISPNFSNEQEADRHWIKHETDPEAIATRYHLANFDTEHTADYKEHHIHEYLGSSKINASDFQKFGDNNLLKGDPDFKRRWIDTSNKGLPIDTQAQELSNKTGLEVTPQDIVDFVSKYRGKNDFQEKAKTGIQKDLEDKYRELTGKDLTDKRAEESYTKSLEGRKDAVLDDQARDIIESEGITKANIDKLRDQFKGFPYTEEDFNNVKRYLDEREQTKPEKPAGNNAVASPGTKSESVQPEQPGGKERSAGKQITGTEGGLSEKQQKIADDYNKVINAAQDRVIKKHQEIENKLAELSKRNNLFGDDEVSKKTAQQTIMGVPMNVSSENIKSVIDPLQAELEKLQNEVDYLKNQRQKAIDTAHQQTSVFDPVKTGEELEKQINVNPDGTGRVKKVVKDSLSDEKKKRFDELRKKIKQNIRQDNNDTSGEAGATEFNHELYASGIELTSLYFEAGVTKFNDFAEEMISDMGKDVIPYLSSFYEGAKRLPGQSGDFDSTDAVDYYMAKLTEPVDASRVFIDRVKAEIAAGNKLSILHLEGMAKEAGFPSNTRVDLQEYVEQGLMEMARDIVDDPFIAPDKIFGELVKLYDKQPSLNQRSSTKVILQQYSTPIPYAYAAGLYVNGIKPERIYDPTAGTGNLTIAFDPHKVSVNEIDPTRLAILENLGFSPSRQDATTLDLSRLPVKFGGIISNPPFGPAKDAVKFHDYTFNKLDNIIPLKALEGMDNAGRAAIIMGGHSSYDKGMLMGGDFRFFNYLHHYYNVTDVINVHGNLFAKQGTSFPTRLILINGRKEVPQGYAPVESEVNPEPVTSYEELYNRIQERISYDEHPAVLQSRVDVQLNPGNPPDVRGTEGLPTEVSRGPAAVPGKPDNETDRTGIESKRAGSPADRGQAEPIGDLFQPDGDSEGDNGVRQLVDVPAEIAKFAEGAAEGTVGPERSGGFVPDDRPVRPAGATADQLVTNDKVPYIPASRATEAGSVIPSNMAHETQLNLKELEELYGPVDTFVANELGYADLDDLNNAFFAEQIDAIGLGIHQLKQGKAIIVGDMTGIGKGRIAAGLIRYAVQQGKTPFFFTENADLFSDIYRDMHGIGSGHLVPFIVNDPSSDRDANVKRNGKVIYNAGTIKDKRRFFESKKVPHGTKVILSTYSQLNNEKQSLKRDFVSELMKDNYVFFDESHNIAGDSQSGKYFQELIPTAKGAAFFSATYAKRADNMPVYALKTSMSDANMTSEALVDAILTGGNAMQEVVASQLVKAGQMIRRERDFTGVVNEFQVLGHDEHGKIDAQGQKHRELADQVIKVCNDIIDFEKKFVGPALDEVQQELRKNGKKVASTKGKELSVANTPFASKMFNIVNQMLFSIKAPSLAQEAIRQLREHNRKPVISFNSTMESFIKNAGYKPGDQVDDVSFSASLMRGLENTLRYRVEYPNGEKYVDQLSFDDLEEAAKDSWNEIVKAIKSASTDMSISPIDTITEILEKEGLKVGEITGRGLKLRYNEHHTSATVDAIGKRDTTGMIYDFNNGGGGGLADVILLNTSGATGFSMHADKSFKDQRQRVMINGQFELDINKEIQKRGRIDRTNQVKRGMYIYVNTAIPAETRLSMMFADKLKKLQANTTSDQRSKANEVDVTDFLNDYGDRVITDYLRDNRSIYNRLYQGADPAGIHGKQPGDRVAVSEGIARRTTGRAALLTVAEQEKFYAEVSQAYGDYIDYLNSTDQNTLAVKSVNLEAKTLSTGTFIQGTHKQSPFGQDSILEKVEANVLRKPMSKEELEEAIEHNLEGKTPPEKSRELVKELREHYAKERDLYMERVQKQYDEQDEKDLKKSKGNHEIYKVLNEQNRATLQQRMQDVENNIASDINKLEQPFRKFMVGSDHPVPSSITGTETKYTKGVFLGFQIKDKSLSNPFRPSNVTMKFAVLDGKRTIVVALSRTEFTNALYAGGQQLSRSELEQAGKLRSQWDSIVKESKPRETRYIVTGNILQAFRADMGQLISYTTHRGSIEKGILMPQGFTPDKEGKTMGAVAMFQAIQNLKPGQEITSTAGVFTISKSGISYLIEVPRSTKIGGRFFKNDSLLDLVDFGEFHTRGQNMQATVADFKLMDLLKVLEKEFSLKFTSGIEMEPVPGSGEQGDSNVAQSKWSKTTTYNPRKEINLDEPIEHSLIEAKRTERIQASNYLPPIEVKKLPDIIGDMAKALNVHIFYAYSKRKNSAGSYNPASGGIKLSRVNNLDTAVHEMGHAIDDLYQLFDTIPSGDHAQVMAELQWFADRGGSNPPKNISQAKQMEYLKREGIAEFIRAYTINPAMARVKAPLFFNHFEATIPDEVKGVLHGFGDDYLRYINSTALDSIMANIEEVPKEQRSAYRKFIESIYGNREGRFSLTPFDHLQIRFTNSGKGFEKAYIYMNELAGHSYERILPLENANNLAKMLAGVDSRIGSFFEDGLVNGKNEPIIDGRTGQRMNKEWLYSAFDTTSPETLKQDQAISIAYMFAERTIEKAIQFDRPNDLSGIAAAGDKNDADIAMKFLIKEFGQDMPREQKIRVLEGARRYQKWADTMMRYMVEKGRMSESSYRDIKARNVAYVAFLPVQENGPGIESYFDNVSALSRPSGLGNVKQVIKEMTGSTTFKRHPYISLLQNTAAMVKEADRNEVLQSFVEPMITTIRNMGEGDINPFANIMMEVTQSEKVQGKPVMTVFLNGEPKYYMFNHDAKDVYDYINGLTKLPQLPAAVTAISRMIRFSVTRFPVFAARNIIRDTVSRLIISRTGSGFGSFVKDREGEKALFKLYGGDQAGYYLSNKVDFYKLQNQMIKDMSTSGKGWVLNPAEMAKIAWDKYETLLAQGEQINRMAEFRSAYAKAIKPKQEGGLGFDEANAASYGASQARDLMDFAVGGTWTKYINLIIPFTNAQVQGLKRSAKAVVEGNWKTRAAFALRLALYTMLPTLLMRWLAQNGDYEEEYDNLPPNQRDMFWNFKIPGMAGWITIPKPFDMGLPSAGIDRAIAKYEGHENAFYGYPTSLYQNFILMKPEMAAGPLSAVVEPLANYSFFKQGPIVPRYEEKKILAMRKKFNQASRIGKAGSEALSPLFKDGDTVDPRYIDNFMRSVFSYYGETMMNLSDIGSLESRQKFGLKTTGFIRDQQIYGDNRVEKLYNVAEDLGLTSTNAIKSIGHLVTQYYDATQPAERERLHREIMIRAKEIYQQWMSNDIYSRKIESRGHQINFK